MDFVERRLAYAQHQRALLFEGDGSRPLDQLRGDAVSDTGQSAHAAWQDNHGLGGIRTARHVRPDVSVRLNFDFARGTAAGFRGRRAEKLLDQVGPAFQAQFFRHDSQPAVRGDEVYGFDALVTFDGNQDVPQK